MSGGSWDYLCYKEASEIENYTHDLERMGERLVKEGYPELGKRFFRFVEYLEIIRAKKEAFMEQYQDLMRAIEWRDSGDYGDDSLKEVLEKFSHPQEKEEGGNGK